MRVWRGQAKNVPLSLILSGMAGLIGVWCVAGSSNDVRCDYHSWGSDERRVCTTVDGSWTACSGVNPASRNVSSAVCSVLYCTVRAGGRT